jgi:hypothetical protein
MLVKVYVIKYVSNLFFNVKDPYAWKFPDKTEGDTYNISIPIGKSISQNFA